MNKIKMMRYPVLITIIGAIFEYSGLLYTTCPEFGNHHSGVWVPLIPA